MNYNQIELLNCLKKKRKMNKIILKLIQFYIRILLLKTIMEVVLKLAKRK